MIINRVLSLGEFVLVIHVTLATTKRNADVRLNKHNNPTKSSEPSKYLRHKIKRCFTWTVILNVSQNGKTRKNLEAPNLYKRKNFERLVLFRNDVT